MFIQRIVPSSFIAGILLSVGTAFAHQPPVLTVAQSSTARAIACEGATARAGDAYRSSSFVRFGDASQVKRDHFVEAKTSAGYRDSFVRFGRTTSALVACSPATPRTTASR